MKDCQEKVYRTIAGERLAIEYQEWYYVTGNGFDTVIMGRIKKKAADADGEGGLTESEAYLWVRQFITEAES